jgi:hypothetical protein
MFVCYFFLFLLIIKPSSGTGELVGQPLFLFKEEKNIDSKKKLT